MKSMRRSTHVSTTLLLEVLLSCWVLLISPSSSFSTTKSLPRHRQRRKNTSSRLCSNASDKQEERVVVVALTREDGKNDKLRKALLSHPRLVNSVALEELPCIAHADGPDLAKLGATLTEKCWDYVAVTSPEAARVLAGAWNHAVWDDASKKPPKVAAVGKATQKALERWGIPVAFCPSKATAKTLVEELPAKEGAESTATTLLYPASAKAKSTLQDGLMARGFDVTRLDTYDTVTATWTNEQQQTANNVGVACFGSPSAVKGWLQNSGNNDREVLAACIGETSAQACREFQWTQDRIFYPEKPGVAGWADAVADALESITVAHHA